MSVPTAEGLHVGSRLRQWRKVEKLTLAQVAEAVDLSTGYISQVERGMANPSLETLKRLTDTLGYTVGELFSNEAPATGEGYTVSKRGQRKRFNYPGSGIENELMSPDLRHQMEVIWVEAPAGATSGGHPHSHVGEECGVVLSGRMIFWVGTDRMVLEKGDSIYLDSTLPHQWEAGPDEPLQAVWIITPPTF